MEQAKAAVASFLGGAGGHKTVVEENTVPAVTRETIKPHRHEIATQAVDRELHQHHFHTTVQPVSHQEVLPEKHLHNPVPIEHREFRHEDPRVGQDNHASHLSNFKPTVNTHQTKHTSTTAPTVAGERTVHHVHEQVQPIIYKEVHQPEVIHTVQPIHELHFAPSEHHGISLLPGRSVNELKAHGIDLMHGSGGVAHQKQDYDGVPRSYNPKFQLTRNPIDIEPSKHHGLHHLEKTGHPYESKFESNLASPVETANGYKPGYSGQAGEPLQTEPGRSASGSEIQDGRNGVGGAVKRVPVPNNNSMSAAPSAISATRSRDSAGSAQSNGAYRNSSSRIDPRSHWATETTTTTTSTTTSVGADGKIRTTAPMVSPPVTSTDKYDSRQRPDSGISIPDRTYSRGQASLDGSVSSPVSPVTQYGR